MERLKERRHPCLRVARILARRTETTARDAGESHAGCVRSYASAANTSFESKAPRAVSFKC